ncbi:lectin BRA-3-like [Saccostrea cucullata]|uniref:lectin BRA-3-like n=1 Tax=Saccostrea cuccullata TaxID=36930 RepID=UPI002ED66D6E
MNWTDAKAQCELQGAYLVEVETMAENTWIQETLILPWNTMECDIWYQCCKTWIGAADMDKEGHFTWNRRTSVDFTNWYKGQPDDIKGKDCVQFCSNGFWDDTECRRNKFFICEKELDF